MANDNIFQQYLTPPKSVMDYAAQYDEADARNQTRQVNALTLAASQQKMADSARDRDADNVLSRLYASGATPDQIGVGLAQAGHGKAALAFTKQQQDLAKVKSDIGHADAQTGKLKAETDDIGVKQREAKRQKAISDIASFTSPQQALDSLALHEQAGDIAPEQAALVRQTIPQNPADFPQWQVGMLQKIATPDKAMGQIAPDANARLTDERTRSEGAAGRAVTMRGQDVSANSAAAARAQAERHFGVTQAAGKVPSGYRLGADGKSLEAIPGGPADQTTAKPNADFLKQSEAYQNMDDALTGYKKELSGFGGLDAINPAKRASMGSAYQNTLLQAKEIYKLGVLNGGDERILKGIINSPLDLSSTIIPKAALMRQAEDLQGIIKRANENLAKVNKQKAVPLPSASAPAANASNKNTKGWLLHTDAKGNRAYVSPDGKQFEEVR